MQIGDRIGTILTPKKDVAEVIGFGVYDGDFIPAEAVGWSADMHRDLGKTNPRIILDSGKSVYACECWLGPEALVKRLLAETKTVMNIDIDDLRARRKMRVS
jgi:hypothetical protein